MKIEEIINRDIKLFMMEKSEKQLNAVRLIKSAIQVEKAKDGVELTDENVLKIIQKLINQSNDSASMYKNAGREDLFNHEMNLINTFKTYLPSQMTEDEVNMEILRIIHKENANTIKDMGRVMAVANKVFLGKADMKMVGGIVKTFLS